MVNVGNRSRQSQRKTTSVNQTWHEWQQPVVNDNGKKFTTLIKMSILKKTHEHDDDVISGFPAVLTMISTASAAVALQLAWVSESKIDSSIWDNPLTLWRSQRILHWNSLPFPFQLTLKWDIIASHFENTTVHLWPCPMLHSYVKQEVRGLRGGS